jgi:hypothetical protein
MAASDISRAAPSAWHGVIYVFGRGMDPRVKDGVRAHPSVLVGGVLLHVGVAAAAIACAGVLTATVWSRSIALLLVLAQAIGAGAGIGLIIRRLRSPLLRAISEPDDYATAALVTAVLAAGAGSVLSLAPQPVFVGLSGALVGYAPFSKVRHCILFFPIRLRYGIWAGRRGLFFTRPRRS